MVWVWEGQVEPVREEVAVGARGGMEDDSWDSTVY